MNKRSFLKKVSLIGLSSVINYSAIGKLIDSSESDTQNALANDERFGIWGGLSERERRKLKKRA